MEQSIHFIGSGHERRAIARGIVNRLVGALRPAILATLQLMLGTFVVGYPLLRLGCLGPVPEGLAIEGAFGLVAGAVALVLFVLEGRGG